MTRLIRHADLFRVPVKRTFSMLCIMLCGYGEVSSLPVSDVVNLQFRFWPGLNRNGLFSIILVLFQLQCDWN